VSQTDHEAMSALLVRRAEMAADGIRIFELARDDGGDLPAFTPGAHLKVRAPNGLIRRYSLSGDPDARDFYQFAIKREAEGSGGSRSLVDDVRVGDALEVSMPRNDFALAPNAASYIFIAGGIGVTPMMSMARHLISTAGRPFRLYYLGRDLASMAFRDELAAPEFHGRVVMHTDGGDPEKSYDLWPVLERPKGAHLYCCGPRGLMQAVRDMTGHWSSGAVHFEDFGTAKASVAEDREFTVRLAKSGAVHVIPPGRNVLEVLRDAGVAIQSSCEAGSCGTCIVDVVSGEMEHRDLVLAEHEKARKFVACISRAHGELVLDL
jgi:phthalate 4,5-dioxygenase reductase subunit